MFRGNDENPVKFDFQHLKEPDEQETRRLCSLPYHVWVADLDPIYLISEYGLDEAIEYIGLKKETFDREKLDLLLKMRGQLSQIEGFFCNYVDLGLFFYANTLLEACQIAKKAIDIQTRFIPLLYPDRNMTNILSNIHIDSQTDWMGSLGHDLHTWLRCRDKWSQYRYEYANEVIDDQEIDFIEKLWIFKALFLEATTDQGIIKLFSDEIQFLRGGIEGGCYSMKENIGDKEQMISSCKL